jgi:hypothetical protein
MATKKKRTAKVRNIGQEILDGLREINAGKVGRVINRPDVGKVREKTGRSSATCSCGGCRSRASHS